MAVEAIEEARASRAGIDFAEIDVTARPEMAVRYGIVATPAIVVNGVLKFTGAPSADALRACLQSAGEETRRTP